VTTPDSPRAESLVVTYALSSGAYVLLSFCIDGRSTVELNLGVDRRGLATNIYDLVRKHAPLKFGIVVRTPDTADRILWISSKTTEGIVSGSIPPEDLVLAKKE
jgi:hypothetical protein